MPEDVLEKLNRILQDITDKLQPLLFTSLR
jgi:hypothetical protein